MAYRSDLEAALARLDAMSPSRPCPACIARSQRHRRVAMFVVGVFAYLAAFALMIFASIAGFVALAALFVGMVLVFARGGPHAAPFGVALLFALLCAGGFLAFAYLERLLAFDVGRFG